MWGRVIDTGEGTETRRANILAMGSSVPFWMWGRIRRTQCDIAQFIYMKSIGSAESLWWILYWTGLVGLLYCIVVI